MTSMGQPEQCLFEALRSLAGAAHMGGPLHRAAPPPRVVPPSALGAKRLDNRPTVMRPVTATGCRGEDAGAQERMRIVQRRANVQCC